MRRKLTVILISFSFLLTACSVIDTTSEPEAPQEDQTPETNDEAEENGEAEASSNEEEELQNESEYANAFAENLDEREDEDGLTVIQEPDIKEVVVNKNRKLPEGYEPDELVVPDVRFPFDDDHPKKYMQPEAADALEQLFNAADEQGLDLYATSGYRSYDRQKTIYENNVAERGQEEADKFSARPGTSEHQTGLAMDVTSPEMEFKLDQSFIDTEEGEWLADHAHEHGFVIRYLEGTSDITGYEYEPWHLRYIGKDLSAEIHESGGTLEEFFGFYPE
ncbi:M15 family metallopeptidase [Halobacillus campisalis]|uniref:D-alanyl-D-alanine carboxypeptidase family protein n=1 Tax=Halobacillus campisalis TaxID=435909 RepID=A0ABW2K090_9BACI|nr:M15 family metallopeptidase [Halobacillus campisalis]